jgi:hypothetical protein
MADAQQPRELWQAFVEAFIASLKRASSDRLRLAWQTHNSNGIL